MRAIILMLLLTGSALADIDPNDPATKRLLTPHKEPTVHMCYNPHPSEQPDWVYGVLVGYDTSTLVLTDVDLHEKVDTYRCFRRPYTLLNIDPNWDQFCMAVRAATPFVDSPQSHSRCMPITIETFGLPRPEVRSITVSQ